MCMLCQWVKVNNVNVEKSWLKKIAPFRLLYFMPVSPSEGRAASVSQTRAYLRLLSENFMKDNDCSKGRGLAIKGRNLRAQDHSFLSNQCQ